MVQVVQMPELSTYNLVLITAKRGAENLISSNGSGSSIVKNFILTTYYLQLTT